MGEYTVKLSEIEEKALLTDMISIQEWLENAIHNKVRQCIDKIVLEYSDRNPQKIDGAEKLQIVEQADVMSASDRMAEIDELEAR